MPANTNDPQECFCEAEGLVKLTLTDRDGTVLDSSWYCLHCGRAVLKCTGLRADLARLDDERKREAVTTAGIEGTQMESAKEER